MGAVRHLLLCAAASLIAARLCFAQHTLPSYQVLEVPLRPAAIDDAGDVAGTTPEHRAALWSRKAGLRLIPLPQGLSHSEALAMNQQGQVAGIAYDAGFTTQRSFLASDHSVTLLDGEAARVHAIGSDARAAGESVVPGQPGSQPVAWSGVTPRTLENCCGGSAQATNEAGQVAGTVYDPQGHYHAVLWDGTRARPIGPDGYSSVIAMNNRGEILIQALSHVYLYSASGLSRLDLAPKPAAHARAISDQGVVVGYVGPFSDAARAFLWSRASGFVDLNSRLRANSQGWKLESATGINNRGEIVGKGDTARADNVGFLLLPVQ
jgi:probable HAF family extracellular repeat protein